MLLPILIPIHLCVDIRATVFSPVNTDSLSANNINVSQSIYLVCKYKDACPEFIAISVILVYSSAILVRVGWKKK